MGFAKHRYYKAKSPYLQLKNGNNGVDKIMYLNYSLNVVNNIFSGGL
jgi:hypothetical protein